MSSDAETIWKKMLIVAKWGNPCVCSKMTRSSCKTVCIILSSQWKSYEQPWDVAQSFGKSQEALWDVGGRVECQALDCLRISGLFSSCVKDGDSHGLV